MTEQLDLIASPAKQTSDCALCRAGVRRALWEPSGEIFHLDPEGPPDGVGCDDWSGPGPQPTEGWPLDLKTRQWYRLDLRGIAA